MNRRNYLKTFSLGTILPAIGMARPFNGGVLDFFGNIERVSFESNWHNWHDMKWVGPEYWGNRMQDWIIEDGKAVCKVSSVNRNLNLLTIQKSDNKDNFEVSASIDVLNDNIKGNSDAYVGFSIGVKGKFDDYRSASVFGKGTDIGVTGNGKLKIGKELYDTGLSIIPNSFGLSLKARYKDGAYELAVTLVDGNGEDVTNRKVNVSMEAVTGNFSLIAHAPSKKVVHEKIAAFSEWKISSSGLNHKEDQLYGPICFAQYTLHANKLKLTAQLTPFEEVPNHKVSLQLYKEGKWQTIETRENTNSGRAVNFVIKEWEETEDVPYRLLAELPLKNEMHHYFYDGTIAKEPLDEEEIKAGVFSCNFHYGFPDQDVCDNVSYLDPDIILFLGDQFYEGTGGYGVQFEGEFDELCIEYLRKWLLFGWSYRELFRHKPCAIIPDDHDVYHGNVWGEGGEAADTSEGYGASAQDSGGYKMSPEWLNMIQFTQTSHLPDPYDPTPVKRGIGVYYTHWKYAGLSFAILEDRKFKSAPMHVLPKEADIWNGWIRNENFDIKKHRDLDAELLGKRQEDFLESWVEDWKGDIQMKVVLSQTNFATVATLPKEAKTDEVVPKLNIPNRGEYVLGDDFTADMDSNGWPANKRDKAVEIIRKGFAFHIAGDQHLGSFIKYGVEEHGDGSYVFAGPALNNIWPRRFWPPVKNASQHTLQNPAYIGDHIDGFGNKMTVLGVGNPFQTHHEPAVLHDRATGFGLVTFNKSTREITTECWPRYTDIKKDRSQQYNGWPFGITQEDNYTKKEEFLLPTFNIDTINEVPVVKLYKDKELVYAIRPKSTSFQLKTFNEGNHEVILLFENTSKESSYSFEAKKINQEIVKV
ncbi:alkaline phosphatase D family protein [Joostella sp.]|uniref:alkaline phosphatase D family protein n=1 Tax=Joostella sp. TaxID=2231138 RepID=UPI003A93CA46